MSRLLFVLAATLVSWMLFILLICGSMWIGVQVFRWAHQEPVPACTLEGEVKR